MSYVPELRESLVKAASRQASAAPRASRRSRPFAALGLTLASATAIVVAGVALVLAGHRAPAPEHASTTPATVLAGRPAASAAARRLIVEFTPPPDAVPVSADLSRPPRLGSPGETTLGGTVDIHRFYVVPGDPQAVMNAIQSANAQLRGYQTSGSEAASASASTSGRSSASVVEMTTATFRLPLSGRVLPTLEVAVATAGHGRSAIRVDAQAEWLAPRPSQTLIPGGTTTIAVKVLGGRQRLDRLGDRLRVPLVVGFLNSLPAAAHSSAACGGVRIMLTFLRTGGPPLATAVVHPACGLVDLTVGARRLQLTWMSRANPAPAGSLIALLDTLGVT